MGAGGEWTEEEPAQTETRRCLCFGTKSPSGLAPSSLWPALQYPPASTETQVLKAELGSPRGSPHRTLLLEGRPENLPP